MQWRLATGVGLGCLLVLAAAGVDRPPPPKSPKATDALRVDAAAIRKATAAYWAACGTADRRLLNELRSAVDAAHARNDGAEEQACLSAAKDASQRVADEADPLRPAAPPQPFRFEAK